MSAPGAASARRADRGPKVERGDAAAPPPESAAPPQVEPRELPFIPLGYRDDFVFGVATGGGLLTARHRDLDRFGAMIAWYGSVAALCEAWPRRELKGGQWQIVPGKYSRDAAIAGIVRRCREAGEFHPESQVSGVGVWPNRKANGERELIVNFGGQCGAG
jgi:hypothetical protein